MTRQLTILILCMFSTVFSVFAEQQEEFVLNDANQFTQTINFNNLCEFTVKRVPGNNPDIINLSFAIKNTSDHHGLGLILFKNNYYEKKNGKEGKDSWKDLKNSFYEIKVSNNFFKSNGVKGVAPGFLTENVFIDLNDSIELPMDNFKYQEGSTIKIPIYQCQIERKKKIPKKLTIKSEDAYSIAIKVELGPDTEFENLTEESNQFIKRIDKATFCVNSKHPTTLEEQFKVYADQKAALVKRIKDRANNRDGLLNDDLKGTKYGDLIQQLDLAILNKQKAINEKKCFKDCNKPPCRIVTQTCKTCRAELKNCAHNGQHPRCKVKGCRKVIDRGGRVKNRCPYDGVHPHDGKTIKKKLEKIYTELDNTSPRNKEAAKEKAKKKAKLWYQKALELPDSDKYKQGCVDIYNKIINYKL